MRFGIGRRVAGSPARQPPPRGSLRVRGGCEVRLGRFGGVGFALGPYLLSFFLGLGSGWFRCGARGRLRTAKYSPTACSPAVSETAGMPSSRSSRPRYNWLGKKSATCPAPICGTYYVDSRKGTGASWPLDCIENFRDSQPIAI